MVAGEGGGYILLPSCRVCQARVEGGGGDENGGRCHLIEGGEVCYNGEKNGCCYHCCHQRNCHG